MQTCREEDKTRSKYCTPGHSSVARHKAPCDRYISIPKLGGPTPITGKHLGLSQANDLFWEHQI